MNMNPSAQELVRRLHLRPHPEGGYYRQLFCSSATVIPFDGRGNRPAITTIYFLLADKGISRWHRVLSDEIWHFYQGNPLSLYVIDPGFESLEEFLLGPVKGDMQPVAVVPAGYFQAARTHGDYTLVGCSVGPGFQYEDFDLLSQLPEERERLLSTFPDLARFL